jgi:hypothetical protein
MNSRQQKHKVAARLPVKARAFAEATVATG